MINVEINGDTSLYYIEQKLRSLKKKAPNILVRALNDTAKDARKELQLKAKEAYTVKAGKFNKSMSIKKANKGKLTATIEAEGKPLPMSSFSTKFTQGEAAKAKGLKRSQFKPFVISGADSGGKDLKGFITKFSSGHVALVQRVPGKKMRNKNKQAIKEFYSVGIPKMIGSEEHVYGIVKPNIKSNLKKNIDAEMAKVIAKNGGGN